MGDVKKINLNNIQNINDFLKEFLLFEKDFKLREIFLLKQKINLHNNPFIILFHKKFFSSNLYLFSITNQRFGKLKNENNTILLDLNSRKEMYDIYDNDDWKAIKKENNISKTQSL
jgi:hypothetical protein